MSAQPAPSNNQRAVAALLRSHLDAGAAPAAVWSPGYVPLRRHAPGPSAAPPAAASSAGAPPPGCPMHTPGAPAGAGPSASPFAPKSAARPHESAPASGSSSGPSLGWSAALNPLNYMPSLSQTPAPAQTSELPTERVRSTIPRAPTSPSPGASPYDAPSSCPVKHDGSSKADGEGANWEYPSPQQFYNALVRKGWETPEEHVEMMVLVHNFLNERAWREVLDWEKEMGSDPAQVSLARFQGRPGTLSPKARLFSWLGTIAPSRFNSEPPFDRHDWVVRRPAAAPGAQPHDVRYVIDYYSCPDDEDGEPVFHLDIRPALDSFEAARARMRAGWREWTAPSQGQASQVGQPSQA